MASEAKLQSRIHKHLKTKGWLPNKIMICSVNGWPDTLAIKKGRVVFIEHKAKSKKLKPLQVYVHEVMKLHGAEVYMVDSWESFMELKLK